jgi:hypothetical protein
MTPEKMERMMMRMKSQKGSFEPPDHDLRQEPIVIDKVFERDKRKLHELYKLLKAGLISPQDIDPREKRLLRIYYGFDTRKH